MEKSKEDKAHLLSPFCSSKEAEHSQGDLPPAFPHQALRSLIRGLLQAQPRLALHPAVRSVLACTMGGVWGTGDL